MHDTVARGTLKSILIQANIELEEFLKLLWICVNFTKMPNAQLAVWRNGGGSPHELAVEIWMFVRRITFTGNRRCAKPLGRCASAARARSREQYVLRKEYSPNIPKASSTCEKVFIINLKECKTWFTKNVTVIWRMTETVENARRSRNSVVVRRKNTSSKEWAWGTLYCWFVF
jgi:hypothetical protein